jgi:hypothetical protein
MKGGLEVTGRRGRKRKQLLDDLKETRGHCKLKEEALDRTVWRTGFGSGYGLVRQTAVRMSTGLCVYRIMNVTIDIIVVV